MRTPQSFREARWSTFECELRAWLDTPEGRFAEYWASRQRDLEERRALRRVALAASVLPAPCVGCALRLALVSRGERVERVLDELLAGMAGS